MGWFDGWFGSGSSQDPFRSLDPKVRELLERESPVKYRPDPTEAKPRPRTEQAPTSPDGAVAESQAQNVPRESLFQDGRYADLWKTYRPQSEVEAETKTDQEKLMDMLESYKSRNQKIGKAALENCALEQEDWRNCMKAGGWDAKMAMCRHQVRKFERCYLMQTRLLKALGYMASFDIPDSTNEDIQMHADALFQRMLAQEKTIEEAKKDGRPIPKFDSLLPKPAPDANPLEANEEVKKAWKAALEKLPEEDRAAEERALRADFDAKAKVAQDVQKLWDEQAESRKVRKAEGKVTWLDTMREALGGRNSRPDS